MATQHVNLPGTNEVIDFEDIFFTDKEINYDKIATYNWYYDEPSDALYVKAGSKVVYFSWAVISTNPILNDSINILRAQAQPGTTTSLYAGAKQLKTLHTIYNFLEEQSLIADNAMLDLQRRLEPEAIYLIQNAVRKEILRQSKQKLSAIVLNTQGRSGKYWENKMDVMAGISADGNWSIVDFDYTTDWDYCELGHPIKEVVYVKDNLTGQVTKWGTTCIDDFLDLTAEQHKLLSSMFNKYRNMIIDYWLLLSNFQQNQEIYMNLQVKQLDIIDELNNAKLLDFSPMYNTGQSGIEARPNRRIERLDKMEPTADTPLTITKNIIAEMHLFAEQSLFFPDFLARYVVNPDTLDLIDKYIKLVTANYKMGSMPLTFVELSIILKTLLQGVYGFTIEDAQALLEPKNKTQYTDYIGNILLKGYTKTYLEKLRYPRMYLTDKKYLTDTQIINIATNPLYTVSNIIYAYTYYTLDQIELTDGIDTGYSLRTSPNQLTLFTPWTTIEINDMQQRKLNKLTSSSPDVTLYDNLTHLIEDNATKIITIKELDPFGVLRVLSDANKVLLSNESKLTGAQKQVLNKVTDANVNDYLKLDLLPLMKYITENPDPFKDFQGLKTYNLVHAMQLTAFATAWLNLFNSNNQRLKEPITPDAKLDITPMVLKVMLELIDDTKLNMQFRKFYAMTEVDKNGVRLPTPGANNPDQERRDYVKPGPKRKTTNRGTQSTNQSNTTTQFTATNQEVKQRLAKYQGLQYKKISRPDTNFFADNINNSDLIFDLMSTAVNSIKQNNSEITPTALIILVALSTSPSSDAFLDTEEKRKLNRLKTLLVTKLLLTMDSDNEPLKARDLNFIINKVLPTCLKSGVGATDKQWQYGGDKLLKANRVVINNIYKAVHNL